MTKATDGVQGTKRPSASLLIRYKKASFTAKVITLVTILVLAFLLVYNLFLLVAGKWKDLSIHSIWVVFGWVFIAVFLYLVPNLISYIGHYHRKDMGELERQQELNERRER